MRRFLEYASQDRMSMDMMKRALGMLPLILSILPQLKPVAKFLSLVTALDVVSELINLSTTALATRAEEAARDKDFLEMLLATFETTMRKAETDKIAIWAPE